jgi:ActR/RegA family two-component response regulator
MPTVLVIDENRATLDTIGRALVDAGFSIVLASTGSEGLRLAAARTIDLVVADLRLPDGTDVEVLKQLRQTLTNVPVLVTGLASTASAIEAGKLGAVDYGVHRSPGAGGSHLCAAAPGGAAASGTSHTRSAAGESTGDPRDAHD